MYYIDKRVNDLIFYDFLPDFEPCAWVNKNSYYFLIDLLQYNKEKNPDLAYLYKPQGQEKSSVRSSDL